MLVGVAVAAAAVVAVASLRLWAAETCRRGQLSWKCPRVRVSRAD